MTDRLCASSGACPYTTWPRSRPSSATWRRSGERCSRSPSHDYPPTPGSFSTPCTSLTASCSTSAPTSATTTGGSAGRSLCQAVTSVAQYVRRWPPLGRLPEDDLDRLQRTQRALPAIHAVFTYASALVVAWQSECGSRAGLCRRLRDLTPADFQQLYLDPLVFAHAAPGTRSPPELDGKGRGDGHLYDLTVPLISFREGVNGTLHMDHVADFSGLLPPLNGNATRVECRRRSAPPSANLLAGRPTTSRASPRQRARLQRPRRPRPQPGRRSQLITRRLAVTTTEPSPDGIDTDELVAPLLTFSPARTSPTISPTVSPSAGLSSSRRTNPRAGLHGDQRISSVQRWRMGLRGIPVINLAGLGATPNSGPPSDGVTAIIEGTASTTTEEAVTYNRANAAAITEHAGSTTEGAGATATVGADFLAGSPDVATDSGGTTAVGTGGDAMAVRVRSPLDRPRQLQTSSPSQLKRPPTAGSVALDQERASTSVKVTELEGLDTQRYEVVGPGGPPRHPSAPFNGHSRPHYAGHTIQQTALRSGPTDTVVQPPQTLLPAAAIRQPQTLLPAAAIRQPQTLLPAVAIRQPQTLLPPPLEASQTASSGKPPPHQTSTISRSSRPVSTVPGNVEQSTAISRGSGRPATTPGNTKQSTAIHSGPERLTSIPRGPERLITKSRGPGRSTSTFRRPESPIITSRGPGRPTISSGGPGRPIATIRGPRVPIATHRDPAQSTTTPGGSERLPPPLSAPRKPWTSAGGRHDTVANKTTKPSTTKPNNTVLNITWENRPHISTGQQGRPITKTGANEKAMIKSSIHNGSTDVGNVRKTLIDMLTAVNGTVRREKPDTTSQRKSPPTRFSKQVLVSGTTSTILPHTSLAAPAGSPTATAIKLPPMSPTRLASSTTAAAATAAAAAPTEARVTVLLGIHGPGAGGSGCSDEVSAAGVHAWAAVRWAVQRLGRRLGMAVHAEPADHCGSPERAARLLSRGRPPLAVIHDLTGPSAVAMSAALAVRNVTVLGVAGQPDRPLGQLQFSVQPPPEAEAALLATLVRQLGAPRVKVLHSEGSRRRALAAAVADQLRGVSPCLQLVPFGRDAANLTRLMSGVAADSATVVVSLLSRSDLDRLFARLVALPGGASRLLFVGDSTWGENIRLLRRHSLAIDSAVLLRPRRPDLTLFSKQFWRGRSQPSDAGAPDGWQHQYWRQCGVKCTLNAARAGDALLATSSLLSALGHLRADDCARGGCPRSYLPADTGERLASALRRRVSTDGELGLPVLKFAADGFAARPADILNLRNMRRIPTVKEMHYVKVGEVDENGARFTSEVVANTPDGRELPAALWLQGCPSAAANTTSVATTTTTSVPTTTTTQTTATLTSSYTNTTTVAIAGTTAVAAVPSTSTSKSHTTATTTTKTAISKSPTAVTTTTKAAISKSLTAANTTTKAAISKSPTTATTRTEAAISKSATTGTTTTKTSTNKGSTTAVTTARDSTSKSPTTHTETANISTSTDASVPGAAVKTFMPTATAPLGVVGVPTTTVPAGVVGASNATAPAEVIDTSTAAPLPGLHLAARSGTYLVVSLDVHRRGATPLSCGRPLASALTALDWAVAALQRTRLRRSQTAPGLLVLDGCQQPLRRQHQTAALLLAAAGRADLQLAGLAELSGSQTVTDAFGRQGVVSVGRLQAGATSLSLSVAPEAAAAGVRHLLARLQWRLCATVHAPHSAWHASVLRALSAAPAPGRLAANVALTQAADHQQLVAAVSALRTAKQSGAQVLVTLLPAPLTGRLLAALRQARLSMFVISVHVTDSTNVSYAGMRGAIQLVPAAAPHPAGTAPRSSLTSHLWPHAVQDHLGATWADALTAVNALNHNLHTLADRVCPDPTADDCDLSALGVLDAHQLTRHMTSLTFPAATGQPTSFLENHYLASATLQVENLWRDGDRERWLVVGNCSQRAPLRLDADRLVAYDDDGHVMAASSLQSLCRLPADCQLPAHQSVIMEVALDRSSYQLAVLAPVHEQGDDIFSCGRLSDTTTVLAVAAAAWTVHSSTLPVGARVLDSCGRPERARDQLFSLLSSAAADPRRLVGVVSLSEATCAGVADMLQQASVPHVCVPTGGHGAVYDRLAGPYRTVPLVGREVHALVSLVRRLGWEYVSVLHSTDAYGVHALHQLTETAPQHDICVGSVIGIGAGFDEAEAEGAWAELRRRHAAPTIVLLVSRPEQTRLFLATAARLGVDDSVMFVGGRHWNRRWATAQLAPALRRTVFVTLPEAPPVTAMTRWLAGMTPEKHAPFPNSWFSELYGRLHDCAPGAGRPTCAAQGLTNVSAAAASPYTHHAALAVTTLLDSLDTYLRRHCALGVPCARLVGAELMAHMDSRFGNDSARVLESGGLQAWTLTDGRQPTLLATYRRGLLRLKPAAAAEVARLRRHQSACRAGPCLQTCAGQSDKFASLSVPTPLPDLHGFRSIFGVVCVAFSGLGVLVALICLVYFNISPSRICRSPVDCQVLLGLMLVCCDNAAFLLQPSPAVCGTRRFLTGLAYATVYSALLVKVIHLWRVHGGRCDELSQRGALLVVALCLLAIQALLGAAWLVLSPPAVHLLAGVYRCSPPGRFEQDLAVSLSYVLVLKLTLVCFCLATWRSPESHQEPRWLLCTLAANSLAWAAWLGVSLTGPQERRDGATVLCNLICTSVFFVCLYLRKVLLFNYLWRNPDDPEIHSPMTTSTINNSFLMQMPAKLKNFSLVHTPQLSERIQENARTWNPSTEENSASLSFGDDESMDLDRSLSMHEFPQQQQQRQQPAATCLHVEAVTSSSESEDMDHYDTPKALNEFVRRMDDRTVLVLPTDRGTENEDSKI